MLTKKHLLNRDPVYRNLQTELRRRIHQGDWTKGAMIPSRRALADEFQVSVPTVQKAVADMVSEGILRVNAKRGTYVFGDPEPEITDEPAALRGTRHGAHGSSVSEPATGHVALVADIRPGSTADIANPWPYITVHEAEHTLSQLGVESRFYNRFAMQRRTQHATSDLIEEDAESC